MRQLSSALNACCAVLVAGHAGLLHAVARPETRAFFRLFGLASWYGPGFLGKRTARGERFDPN